MTTPPPGRRSEDEALAEWLRERLRDSESTIDFRHAARLSAARARAVEALHRPGAGLRASGWWPLQGAALVAAAALCLLLSPRVHAPSTAAGNVPQPEVLETLADDAAPAVEDLDFYQWLASKDGHG